MTRGMPLDLLRIAELLGIGLVAGVMGGMLGVGGGLVMIPAMLLIMGNRFGVDSFHLYKLAAISASVLVSIPACLRHLRARAVVVALLPPILPPAVCGVAGGVLLASFCTQEHTHLLRRAFGVFIELVVLAQLYLGRLNRGGEAVLTDICPTPRRTGLLGGLVGLPSGLIAGLLGIGGGAWNVPVLHLLLGVRLRQAIATSTALVIFVSLATAVAQGLAVQRIGLNALDGLALAVILTPGAVIGGWLGADLTHRLPLEWIRLAFLTLLALSGMRLIFAG
jgi:uncharacterized membrane protein YfcA